MQMNAKRISRYEKMVSRYDIEELADLARKIAVQDKSEGRGEFGYAHALGCCNGNAKAMLAILESILEAK